MNHLLTMCHSDLATQLFIIIIIKKRKYVVPTSNSQISIHQSTILIYILPPHALADP